jgi:hypothetical protein
MKVVRTKMSKTAARTRNRDPIAWLRTTVLQRTVYGDTLCARLSTFPMSLQCYKQLKRTAQRKDAASSLLRLSGIGVT